MNDTLSAFCKSLTEKRYLKSVFMNSLSLALHLELTGTPSTDGDAVGARANAGLHSNRDGAQLIPLVLGFKRLVLFVLLLDWNKTLPSHRPCEYNRHPGEESASSC